MKKLFFLFLAFALMPYIPTNAQPPDLIPIDAVLVLDISLSMRTADPQRVSQEAMVLFAEKLTPMRDRIAVIAYAGRVESVLPLTEITPDNLQAVTYFINNLYYASWTDHGVGLIEAVQILEAAQDDERQGIIIFLTDGNMNVNPWGERTNDCAQDDVNYAIQTARELQIPIHTIGLNFDGNLYIEYIDNIAEETGGLAFETADARDIYYIIEAFFYQMMTAPHVELEPEPTPEPTPTPAPTPYVLATDYTENAENTDYFPPSRRMETLHIIAFAAIISLTAAILLRKATKNRVFTGKLEIQIPCTKTRLTRNLIEYGNKTTLSALTGEAHAAQFPHFAAIILRPSPSAPSHLPQIQIKCKAAHIKFTQDFLPQPPAKFFPIGENSEITVETDNPADTVLLKYFI